MQDTEWFKNFLPGPKYSACINQKKQNFFFFKYLQLTCLFPQPRDLWSAGRREKEEKEKEAMAVEEDEQEEEEADEEEEEEEEDMEVGGGEEEEEDEDQEGEDDSTSAPISTMVTARVEHARVGRARRASAPAMTTPTFTYKPSPSEWSVEEVSAFIHTLPG